MNYIMFYHSDDPKDWCNRFCNKLTRWPNCCKEGTYDREYEDFDCLVPGEEEWVYSLQEQVLLEYHGESNAYAHKNS